MAMFYFLDKNANHAQETSLLSSSFPHLRGGYLVVNVLYFCTFRDQTSNLSNFHLLRAHGTLSCFCLLFFLARMPSILLLNTCSSIRSRRQCRLSHDGIPPGGEWSLAPCDVHFFSAAKACRMSTAAAFCFAFLLLFKLSEVRYLGYVLCSLYLLFR